MGRGEGLGFLMALVLGSAGDPAELVARSSAPLKMEAATLVCPKQPILPLHAPAVEDYTENVVPHFLVRYVPLVDGLMTFSRHNLFRCLMEINRRLPARIDPSAVFHYHLFTYVDHVEIWNCPGSFAEVAYYLEKNQDAFRDLGIGRIYFIVLATETQFRSFHRLNNVSVQSDFVRLLRTEYRVPLHLSNPFQTQRVGKVATKALPLCELSYPDRLSVESGNLSVFEEAPLFSGKAVLTLKSVSVLLAGLVLSVVLVISICLGACYLGERRQERMTIYKGLHCPTLDYDRSYIDLSEAGNTLPRSLLPQSPVRQKQEEEETEEDMLSTTTPSRTPSRAPIQSSKPAHL